MPRHSNYDSSDDSREHRRHRHRRSRSRSSEKSSSSSSVHKSSKKNKSSKDSRSCSHSRSNSRERRKDTKRNNSDWQSRSRHRESRSHSSNRSKREHSVEKIKAENLPATKPAEADTIVKVSDLSPEEQLKIKMQLALKAAAEADAQLREKGILPAGNETKEKAVTAAPLLTVQEQISRAQAIDVINAPEFQPQEFKSKKSLPKGSSLVNSPADDHSTAIFGSNMESKVIEDRIVTKPNVILDRLVRDQLVHENLFADATAKQERWVKKLYSMRQRRLNGEAMS